MRNRRKGLRRESRSPRREWSLRAKTLSRNSPGSFHENRRVVEIDGPEGLHELIETLAEDEVAVVGPSTDDLFGEHDVVIEFGGVVGGVDQFRRSPLFEKVHIRFRRIPSGAFCRIEVCEQSGWENLGGRKCEKTALDPGWRDEFLIPSDAILWFKKLKSGELLFGGPLEKSLSAEKHACRIQGPKLASAPPEFIVIKEFAIASG